MFERLKKFFGIAETPDYAELIKTGAIVLDVRSKREYSAGHVNGSINIPLDILQQNLNKLRDKNRPIITCCASGMRSSSARGLLKASGYKHVFNGGGWQSLERKLKR